MLKYLQNVASISDNAPDYIAEHLFLKPDINLLASAVSVVSVGPACAYWLFIANRFSVIAFYSVSVSPLRALLGAKETSVTQGYEEFYKESQSD